MSEEQALEITDQIARQQRGMILSKFSEAGLPDEVLANLTGISLAEVKEARVSYTGTVLIEDETLNNAYRNLEALAIREATVMLRTAPPAMKAGLIRAILTGVGRRAAAGALDETERQKSTLDDMWEEMKKGIPANNGS